MVVMGVLWTVMLALFVYLAVYVIRWIFTVIKP